MKSCIFLDVCSFSSSAVIMACLSSLVICSSVNEMLVKERLRRAWKS